MRTRSTKKTGLIIVFIFLACLSLILWQRKEIGYDIIYQGPTDITKFSRNINEVDFSGLTFTPWDVEAVSANLTPAETKPYTIMLYMNGSDLESEYGAATNDLIEMLDSDVSKKNINLILLTGGTHRWQNNVVPENTCMIWQIADGKLYELADPGLRNMGDPGTLSSFIDFGMRNFPAEKYGLILWDHGGGSIAGYGHDEKFNEDNLTLIDMNYAFLKSGAANKKLEFLGFDSCLMATVEMAVVAADYAEYMVAAEDLEPGDGWDYGFLSELNANPGMDGAALGKVITDYFMSYYGRKSDEILTLSVIDLANSGQVMGAMGDLMDACSDSLLAERSVSFKTLAKKRSGTKTFGEGSPRDNQCDMVDIDDMAAKLSDLFPEETGRLRAAIANAVVYNRHNSNVSLGGLSSYYIYGGRDTAEYSLSTYSSLNMNSYYTDYLHDFSFLLSSGLGTGVRRSATVGAGGSASALGEDDIICTDLTAWRPVEGSPEVYIMTGIIEEVDEETYEAEHKDALWPQIEGNYVCLYKVANTDGCTLYAVPVDRNGERCDLIISISEEYPHGKIMGARQESGFIIQKGYDPLKEGDQISVYYQERSFGEETEAPQDFKWYKGQAFTLKGEPVISWVSPEPDMYQSLRLTDYQKNVIYTELEYPGVQNKNAHDDPNQNRDKQGLVPKQHMLGSLRKSLAR